MRFLVIGQGGREHALVRALKMSPSVSEVHVVPGSAGMGSEAIRHEFAMDNQGAWDDFLTQMAFDCAVIGPEVPLANGLADMLRNHGVPTVGPSQTAARLEASKVFAKEFMKTAGVPTARFFVVDSTAATLESAKAFAPPYVLKADGLAAGKGVLICENLSDLEAAAESLFTKQVFGDAGRTAVLEEFQDGYEISYLILTNGREFQSLPVAQDHKRLLDNDQGPNTGGMGVVGPVELQPALRQRIHAEIVEPVLRQISGMGLLYRGVLYFGLMMTDQGPSVLEFNVRFGDPEAQVILPLLEGDWGRVFRHLADGELVELSWKNLFAACVVMAAPGYPDAPKKGVEIEGDLASHTMSKYFLHSGTKNADGKWTTDGGRVLNAIGLGTNLKAAIANAYGQARLVKWPGMLWRKDIGSKQV